VAVCVCLCVCVCVCVCACVLPVDRASCQVCCWVVLLFSSGSSATETHTHTVSLVRCDTTSTVSCFSEMKNDRVQSKNNTEGVRDDLQWNRLVGFNLELLRYQYHNRNCHG